jgi:hypothetical protein
MKRATIAGAFALLLASGSRSDGEVTNSSRRESAGACNYKEYKIGRDRGGREFVRVVFLAPSSSRASATSFIPSLFIGATSPTRASSVAHFFRNRKSLILLI